MLLTTLCYIEHKGHYLMLHRNKKANDINEGKWIGVGGKFRDGESPEECLKREVLEETGYELTSWRFRGFITFIQEDWGAEYMCLYTADDFIGLDDPAFASEDPSDWPVPKCDEGELAWIKKNRTDELALWPGDRIFLKLLREESEFFSLKLRYRGDELIESTMPCMNTSCPQPGIAQE